MKSFVLTSLLALTVGLAHAEREYFYAHSLQWTKGTAIGYTSQGEGYNVSSNLSPTHGLVSHASSVYTMPADVKGQNLLFEVTPGYTIDNLLLQMSDNEFSDQYDGGPDTDGFVLLTGIEIDGKLTAYHDTLWNGRNSSLPEEKPRFREYLLRGIGAQQSIRLHFDCSGSNRILNPQPDQYTGETYAHGEVIVGMVLDYDLPAATYERVTQQSQVEAGGKYIITACAGDKVMQLASDSTVTAAGNIYQIGKPINMRPTDTKYEGPASMLFELVSDDTGFGTPGTFFLNLPLHYDTRFGLRTSGLSFYLDERGTNYYANYDFLWDPIELVATNTIIGRTLYRDLWEIVINDDQTVSFYSHEMANQPGRELQYRADRNYFIYQTEFTYDAPLYLWRMTGQSQSIETITDSRALTDAPAYNLMGQPASPARRGIYVQDGHRFITR